MREEPIWSIGRLGHLDIEQLSISIRERER